MSSSKEGLFHCLHFWNKVKFEIFFKKSRFQKMKIYNSGYRIDNEENKIMKSNAIKPKEIWLNHYQ